MQTILLIARCLLFRQPLTRRFYLAVFASGLFCLQAQACTVPNGSFCVDYYNGETLSGPVIATGNTNSINYNFIANPQASVPSNLFSGRWSGYFNFTAGQYIFQATADDGVKLLIDGKPVIDGWKDQPPTQYQATVTLAAGSHLIEIDYYQGYGGAVLQASWQPVRSCDLPVGQFCVAYYSNATLSGNPQLIVHETTINHPWGYGSPDPGIPNYNFSGHWQGQFNFNNGAYTFNATSDDGVLVSIDGQPLINAFYPQAATTYQASLWLSGLHTVTVDYFQAYGAATLQVNWQFAGGDSAYAPIGGNAKSPLGSNLEAWRDWTTGQPFLDLFKTSRSWITQAPGIWDTGEEAKLDLDANGWVRSLPNAADNTVNYRSVSTLLVYGGDLNGVRLGGNYVVLYDGEGVISYSLGAKKQSSLSTPGRDVINVDPNNYGIQLIISQTDPNQTGNYIRNIRVVAPGYVCSDDALAFCSVGGDPACNRSQCMTTEAALSNNQVFNPLYLRPLVDYRTLRFMEPLATNVIDGSQPQLVNWSDRATLSKARWVDQAGIPIEIAVRFANTLNTDAWLNIPHQANDDYIYEYAQLVHQQLNSNSKVYIEYANEIWNTAFSAGSWVEQQGLAKWSNNTVDSAYTKRINWYGMRSAQMCGIWKAAWGGDSGRVVCVLGAQAANTWTANAALDCSLWLQGPCQGYGIDAIAIAPYFGQYIGNPQTQTTVDKWTSSADGGLSQLFTEISNGGLLSGSPTGGALGQAQQYMQAYNTVAKQRKLRLLAYEGGQSLTGIGNVQNDSAITQLFTQANRSTQMGAVYGNYLNSWSTLTSGDLFMHYNAMGAYGIYGSWGILENMNQTTSPKLDAVIQFINNNPHN